MIDSSIPQNNEIEVENFGELSVEERAKKDEDVNSCYALDK